MARKQYSCDFETTTLEDDCRVWAWGYMEIGNKSNYKIGNNIDDFMGWVKKCQADLYFHNLKFDGSFIVNWLLRNGFTWDDSGAKNTFSTTISKMGQWYLIDICFGYKGKRKLHTVIYDSLKKLPFPVEKIGKDFGLEVLKIDKEKEFYERPRAVGHVITEEEYQYVKNDIEVIADALHIQFNEGLDRMTNGSDSLKEFKNSIKRKQFDRLFPVFSFELDSALRKAYRGGFTWLNEKFAGKEIGEGIVFDVNSLYPAQMAERELPYGSPIFFEGKYKEDPFYPLYIQCIECEFEIKDRKIPTIQLKKNSRFVGRDNEYLKSSEGERVTLYLTNIDLELVREHYELYDVMYLGGWKFSKKKGIFGEFIDKWMHIKNTEEDAKKALAKLTLNSLYGKFGSNPDVTGKIPYLKEDGATGFKEGEEDFKDPIYLPMAIFITSWARYTTITAAQKCYDRIIYCDTDSIHLVGAEVPEVIKDVIDPDKLGYWKHEGTFTRAKFIRQKTYIEQFGHQYGWLYMQHTYKKKKVKLWCPRPVVTCAGMPKNIKNYVSFNNFGVGFTAPGKLVPKQVPGGVVLVDREFTIK